MPWMPKPRVPIQLRDGARLTTLADARKLIISLQEPRAAHPNWQLASDLLLAAAGDEIAWDKVGIQLRVALKAEGLI
jgi:hypothetical protein